jgi:hypothetical protein
MMLTACSDSPTEPGTLTVQAVAGVYGASGAFGTLTFATIDSGAVTDWLEAGASISLRLNTDGTTEGELFIPGADEDGSDVEESLTGTWSLAGSVVTLEHDADTFLRDMPLTIVGGRLEGERIFGRTADSSGTRVRLTLQRQ